MQREKSTADRIAGAVLIGAAAGTLIAMGHHPSGAHGSTLAGIVHGGMLVLLAAMAFGFAHFALRRGIDRPAVLAGLVAYGLSLFAHAGAATINGFVVPALSVRGQGAVGHDLFLFAWEANQALARLGVYAAGAAFALWGLDLLRNARWIGAAGLVAGVAPALALAAGWIEMNVAGAFLAYAVHAAFAALVGLELLRGRFTPATD